MTLLKAPTALIRIVAFCRLTARTPRDVQYWDASSTLHQYQSGKVTGRYSMTARIVGSKHSSGGGRHIEPK
jgi:hypothetical protein